MGPMQAILEPRSLAVIGVSSRPESLSAKLLTNLTAAGFRGAIYPINPKAETIASLPCFPSVRELPSAVDLAVVMVPRDAVLATVDECLQAGVRGIVVITAGFREAGAAGAAAERALVERLAGSGVRMVGPNCMGVINTSPAVHLDATFSPARARPGTVAFASHSGALGVAVLEFAAELNLGFSQFVSLGNSADIDVCDLLEVWEEDDGTRTILLYLESLAEPRRFLDLASRITRRKPIVVMKAGRTAAGQRAASSHTGALAAADTAIAALLRQAGVTQADSLEEMIDLTRVFASTPAPRGRRVALVTNAGGPAIAASDALGGAGLTLAELAPATRQALRGFLPPEAAVGNPVDMLPSATAEHYQRALGLVLDDDGVDAAITVTVTPILVQPLAIAGALAAASPQRRKPVLSVFMTAPGFYAQAAAIPDLPPVFRFPEAAVAALGGLLRHAERAADRTAPRPIAIAPPSPVLRRATPAAGGYLRPQDACALLAEAGVAVVQWQVAHTLEEVRDAARGLGFPVVLKAFGEALVHKSELGAVALGLEDDGQLENAFAAMRRRLEEANVAPEGFLVQAQAPPGRETIVGVTRDPSVGPLVMCGMGGVAVEVWKDVSFRVAPIAESEALEMIGELRGAPMLASFRGKPAADRAALAEVIARVSGLAAGNPEIAECDINPLLVFEQGRGALALDVRVRVGPPGGASEAS
jgi:acetate---CoA ligase (ADP-forming)